MVSICKSRVERRSKHVTACPREEAYTHRAFRHFAGWPSLEAAPGTVAGLSCSLHRLFEYDLLLCPNIPSLKLCNTTLPFLPFCSKVHVGHFHLNVPEPRRLASPETPFLCERPPVCVHLCVSTCEHPPVCVHLCAGFYWSLSLGASDQGSSHSWCLAFSLPIIIYLVPTGLPGW